MVCNPEDTDVKLRMPVGQKEVLRGKLFSPVGSRAFFHTGNALAIVCAFEKRSGQILPSEEKMAHLKSKQNKNPKPQESVMHFSKKMPHKPII